MASSMGPANLSSCMCPGSGDASARELLGMYPAANVNTGGAFVNNYIVNRDSKDNTFQFDLRADWNPTSGNQLFARLSLLNEGGNRPPPLGPNLDGGNSLIYGDDGTINNSGRNLAVNYVHVFSEKFHNEVRGGYHRG